MVRLLLVLLVVGITAGFLMTGSGAGTPPPAEQRYQQEASRVHQMEKGLQTQATQQLQDADAQAQ
jgi:hypothetical protein